MKQVYNKIAPTLLIVLFAILTFVIMINHEPWSDEANAWMIAKGFSFFELFKIEHLDGHMFIWHTILMPFAKNNFWYPYSMLGINWIFCVAAIAIFCIKSPFSILEKFLITFSFPFVCYWSSVGRCYSIGILFLFITLAFWEKRFKYPIIISMLLLLASNTSVMAAFGGIALSIILLFDLLKNKQKPAIPILIFFTNITLILNQLLGAVGNYYNFKNTFLLNVLNFFKFNHHNNFIVSYVNIFLAILSLILIIGSIIVFWGKNKPALFFIFATYSGMILLFTFGYPGFWWHYIFFFLYMIVAIWLLKLDNQKINILYKSIFILFLGTFFLKTILFPLDSYSYVYSSNSKQIYKDIIKNKYITQDDKLFIFPINDHVIISIIPMLNMDIYDCFGNNRYSLEGYKLNMANYNINSDTLAKSLDKNRKNKVILYTGVNIQDTENYKTIMNPIYKNEKYTIYEISVKENS